MFANSAHILKVIVLINLSTKVVTNILHKYCSVKYGCDSFVEEIVNFNNSWMICLWEYSMVKQILKVTYYKHR